MKVLETKRWHQGWAITYRVGAFRAVRNGVAMNSQTEQGIIRMIDLRINDERRARKAAGGWAPL